MNSFKFEITKLDTDPRKWNHKITIFAENLVIAGSKVRQIYPEEVFKIKLSNES